MGWLILLLSCAVECFNLRFKIHSLFIFHKIDVRSFPSLAEVLAQSPTACLDTMPFCITPT